MANSDATRWLEEQYDSRRARRHHLRYEDTFVRWMFELIDDHADNGCEICWETNATIERLAKEEAA